MDVPLIVIVAIALVVVLCVTAELLSAVVPLLLVIAFVAPEDRPALAAVLAAADSSHRLRFWPALQAAVAARRLRRRPHGGWR